MFMNRSRQSGFTLIELIIFIVVVSAGLAGILSVMNTVVKSSADPMVRKQAMALADSILEEILLKAYTSSGTGTSRSSYDGVDDYNGKSNATFADLPASLANYTITIGVTDGSATLGVTAKKVTVSISHGSDVVSMTGYRANY